MGSIRESCVAFVVQGSKRVDVGSQSFSFQMGEILVVPGNRPLVSQVVEATPDRPYLAMAVELKPSLLAELIETRGMAASAPCDDNEIRPTVADSDLLDPLSRLSQLLDHPDDVEVLLPMLKREIAWRVLTGPQKWAAARISLMHGEPPHLMRVIRWIHTHYAEPIHVSTLARMAGMSLSSFYRRFEAITTMSPIQYQKLVRLQEARSQLLSAEANATTVAYGVGYRSQSQFSKDYRRMFGIAPMGDVQRRQSMRHLIDDVF